MNQAHYLDANVILRFLLGDDPRQSPKARTLFELAEAGKFTLRVSHVCMAEVTWVLSSFYHLERVRISASLRELVLHDGIEVQDEALMLDALDRFGRINADFIDCYTTALAKQEDCPVITEDRDFRKFPDVTAYRPADIVGKADA